MKRLNLDKLSKEFQENHETGAKEFGGLWLDANAWAISAAQGIDGVTYHEQPFKTLLSRVVLCTLRRALPKNAETGNREFLTAEQVLGEVDSYCATKGNPILASVMRQAFAKDGRMPHAVLASLNLEPITIWRRKQ